MRVRWHVADHRNKVLPKVIIMLWWSFKWCWSTLNKNLLFLKDFLSLFLVASYCWRHDLQKAYKGCVRSHCEEVSIRRRVQKYFQNIRCVLEVHHHVETMSKSDVKKVMKTFQGGFQETYSIIKRNCRNICIWQWYLVFLICLDCRVGWPERRLSWIVPNICTKPPL